jgi:hypothetical protein
LSLVGTGGVPAGLDAMVSRMPSLLAMSTTRSIPIRSSRITNPVFGEVASASCNVILAG